MISILLVDIFFSGIYVESEGELKKYRVEHLLKRGDVYILKLKEINSISEAFSLKGRGLFLPEEDLKFLADGEYFAFQLQGCQVITEQGQLIGEVIDIWFIPNNELLIVKKKGTDNEVLVPFQESICVEVDLSQKKIVISPPEGLLEIDEI